MSLLEVWQQGMKTLNKASRTSSNILFMGQSWRQIVEIADSGLTD